VNGVEEADLVVGVDTHLDTHTAAICDARGRAVPQLQVPATTAGYEQLLAWVRSAAGTGRPSGRWKGPGITGWAWARHLSSAGEQAPGIDYSPHVGKRRAGKSDPIDAVRAARELLAARTPRRCAPTGIARRCGC
jgi:transposase